MRLPGLCAPLLLGLLACRSDNPPNQSRADELFSARALGLGFLQKDQLPEAEQQFKRVIDLAPREPLGYANLGLVYLRGGRYADAETQLQRARKLDPNDAETGLMLAKLFDVTGRRDDARRTLEQLRGSSSAGVSQARVLYALAELESHDSSAAAAGRYEQRLHEAMTLAPANLAIRLAVVDASLRAGHADSAVHQLEEIRRMPPAPPKEATPELESAIRLLRAGRLDEARDPADRLRRALELTKPYQAALDDVRWLEGPIAGRPVLTFNPRTLITMRGAGGATRAANVDDVRFVDATSDAGLPDVSGRAGTVAVGDYDGDGNADVFISAGDTARLFHGQGGQFLDATARAGLTLPPATFATFADVDNDGWLDLFVITADGRARLFRNAGDNGRLEDVTARAGISDLAGATSGLFADLDHDGDLDLLLVGGTRQLVYRNNLDGTFTEAAAAMGLAAAGANDAVFADFDADGRTDVAARRADGVALYHNGGSLRFADSSATSGLRGPAAGGAGVLAAGDYDNDGAIDLVMASVNSGAAFWHNDGRGVFRSDPDAAPMRFVQPRALRMLDVDNDGWLDVLAVGQPAGTARGVLLLRGDGKGRFLQRSDLIPASLTSGNAIAVADIDGDGDLDLFVATGERGVRLLRNDGGNARMAARVELHALRTGSGKNNSFGIGARVELRAGDLYQTRVVSTPVTHFGLGPHLKADVVRIEWPNGVPQMIYFPGSDQDVLEGELLKGSCAFLYTWDGHRFRFVTDVMWRSALGMPLGIMGGLSAFAPAGASQEYLRIPGSALQPRDGRYVLQLTEELWETSYMDEIRLLAVDHPDSIDVFVDERFVPPAPVDLRLYKAAAAFAPLSAIDEHGADVLPALRAMDSVYVSTLTPVEYQGIVQSHDLVMDLGPKAGDAGAHLFLRGWIYPTDASINVALGQQTRLRTSMPSLEVRDARGRWITAVPSIGFPSGKDKTIVLDLAGKFPTRDHHVRIRTNMQIYWDQAFVSVDAAHTPVRITSLAPLRANLHARGFSRSYRKGGRYGPHWFDYDRVTRVDPWRPITGAFTRFGNVLPLLNAPDDMYVIMGPGDETTVEYDAGSAGDVPPGWTRDFLLYTDGWIKDSDLNTAYGTTVEPLPFHAIRAYPYAAGDAYPSDSTHARYQREYNTRVVERSVARRK